MTFAVVGANQKTSAPTSGVKNNIICITNAHGVDEVDHIISSEVLPPAMPFFGTDETLKYSTNNIG